MPAGIHSNNQQFCQALDRLVHEMGL
jgi:hypothetical protein